MSVLRTCVRYERELPPWGKVFYALSPYEDVVRRQMMPFDGVEPELQFHAGDFFEAGCKVEEMNGMRESVVNTIRAWHQGASDAEQRAAAAMVEAAIWRCLPYGKGWFRPSYWKGDVMNVSGEPWWFPVYLLVGSERLTVGMMSDHGRRELRDVVLPWGQMREEVCFSLVLIDGTLDEPELPSGAVVKIKPGGEQDVLPCLAISEYAAGGLVYAMECQKGNAKCTAEITEFGTL